MCCTLFFTPMLYTHFITPKDAKSEAVAPTLLGGAHTTGKMIVAMPLNSAVRHHTAKISLSCDRSMVHDN
jgi:hypothetical protein